LINKKIITVDLKISILPPPFFVSFVFIFKFHLLFNFLVFIDVIHIQVIQSLIIFRISYFEGDIFSISRRKNYLFKGHRSKKVLSRIQLNLWDSSHFAP